MSMIKLPASLSVAALSVAAFLSLQANATAGSLLKLPAVKPDVAFLLVQAEGGQERLNRVEGQMRMLTGQVEELTFQLRQLQEQIKRMQEDNDFRFRDLEGGSGASGPSREDVPSPPGSSGELVVPPSDLGGGLSQTGTQAGGDDAIGALASGGGTLGAPEGGLGAPPQVLGTLSMDAPPPAPEQPIDLTQPPPQGGANSPQIAMIDPSGDPRADYERAYKSILNGDYDTAENGFRQFLASYPDDALAPDAQYWLGESLFVRAEYREAANEFLAGYKTYPQSGKAADTLFKLGLSLAGLGEPAAACSTFSAVEQQYPNASNALKQRIRVEKASAQC